MIRHSFLQLAMVGFLLVGALSRSDAADQPTLHRTGLLVKPIPLGSEKKLATKTAAVLPINVDLSPDFPPIGDQGSFGSCVGWATGYYLKSYQEQAERRWNNSTPDHQFSPLWVYNQINHGVDNGSYIEDALNLVQEKGCDTLANFNPGDILQQPSPASLSNDRPYRIDSWRYLDRTADTLKLSLSQQCPVVIGIAIYPDFDGLNQGNDTYDTYASGTTPRGYHALCLVGYDDSKRAFKFANSWGSGWGLSGYGWISYDFIANPRIVQNAFAITDHLASPELTAQVVSIRDSPGYNNGDGMINPGERVLVTVSVSNIGDAAAFNAFDVMTFDSVYPGVLHLIKYTNNYGTIQPGDTAIGTFEAITPESSRNAYSWSTNLYKLWYTKTTAKVPFEFYMAYAPIEVTSANPPTAAAKTLVCDPNGPVNITLSGTDVDGDALTFTFISQPGHGTLSFVGNTGSSTCIYRPTPNWTGVDQFTYKVSDGYRESPPATVTMTVSAKGAISRQVWTAIPGGTIADIPLATPPTLTDTLSSFQTQTNWADNYGDRVRGYLAPTVSGNYTLWIASDNNGELWLSSDANRNNKRKIAWVTGWTNPKEWNRYTSQRSATITLVAGNNYYIEALHKEGGGSDHLAVAWQGPSIAQQVIPGAVLRQYYDAISMPTGIAAWRSGSDTWAGLLASNEAGKP